MSLYEDLHTKDKQIKILEKQLQQLREDKKQTQQLIALCEKKDGSDKINKLTIINLIKELQVKIDNYHFKNKLAIQVDFDINKMSLIYNYKNEPITLSSSDSTTLAQLEKWITFQSNIIEFYKLLEDIKGDLRWVNSKYNEQLPFSNITFNIINEEIDKSNIKYTLTFNYPDYKKCNLEARQLIRYEGFEIYLGLNDKNLKARIVSTEVDSIDFNPKYDDPTDTFNVYLHIDKYVIDSSTLKDAIEETSKEFFDYNDFTTINH